MTSMTKTWFGMIVLISLTLLIFTQDAYAWGGWGPGNGPIRNVLRARRSGGDDGSGGGGWSGSRSGGSSGGGSSTDYSQPDSGQWATQKSSGSRASESSSDSNKGALVPWDSWTVRVQGEGERTATFTLDAKTGKFNTSDFSDADAAMKFLQRREGITQIESSADYSLEHQNQVGQIRSEALALSGAVARTSNATVAGDVRATVDNERIRAVQVVTKEAKQMDIAYTIGYVGLEVNPSEAIQRQTGQQKLAKESQFELEQLAAGGEYTEHIALLGKYGPGVTGPQLQEMAKKQIQANAEAERKAEEELKNKFTPEVIRRIKEAIDPAEQLSDIVASTGVPLERLRSTAEQIEQKSRTIPGIDTIKDAINTIKRGAAPYLNPYSSERANLAETMFKEYKAQGFRTERETYTYAGKSLEIAGHHDGTAYHWLLLPLPNMLGLNDLVSAARSNASGILLQITMKNNTGQTVTIPAFSPRLDKVITRLQQQGIYSEPVQ